MALAIVTLVTSCASDPTAVETPVSQEDVVAKAAVPSSSSSTTMAMAIEPTSTSTTVVTVSIPRFESAISAIDQETAERMSASWREGCPVGLDDLRLVEVSHWDFRGKAATGELVVHEDHADAIVDVMGLLFDAEFPIERMQLVDEFGADDDASMGANNTSAFNCREVAWKPGVWSNHAFGAAIDINPLVNPYVNGSTVLPPGGASFSDRSVAVTGGIYPGDEVVAAFASIGWGWGGDWAGSAKDWQHFSANGN